MTVEDKVTGKGEHLISSCFHFPANLHLESNVNALTRPRLPFNHTEKLNNLFDGIIEYV